MVETLLPYQTCIYSWDEPLGDRSLIVERLLVEGYLAAAAAAAAATAAGGRGKGGGGDAAPRAFVGVYGLDLMRPPTVAGNMRVGTRRGLRGGWNAFCCRGYGVGGACVCTCVHVNGIMAPS